MFIHFQLQWIDGCYGWSSNNQSWRCTLQLDHPPASWESLNPSAWQNGTTSGCHGMHTVLHGKWCYMTPKTLHMLHICYKVLGRSDSRLVSVVSVLHLAPQFFCLRISFGVSIRYSPACRCDSLRLDTLTCQTQLVSLSCLSTQKTKPGALYRALPNQSWDRLCKVEPIIQEGATTCNTQSLTGVVITTDQSIVRLKSNSQWCAWRIQGRSCVLFTALAICTGLPLKTVERRISPHESITRMGCPMYSNIRRICLYLWQVWRCPTLCKQRKYWICMLNHQFNLSACLSKLLVRTCLPSWQNPLLPCPCSGHFPAPISKESWPVVTPSLTNYLKFDSIVPLTAINWKVHPQPPVLPEEGMVSLHLANAILFEEPARSNLHAVHAGHVMHSTQCPACAPCLVLHCTLQPWLGSYGICHVCQLHFLKTVRITQTALGSLRGSAFASHSVGGSGNIGGA